MHAWKHAGGIAKASLKILLPAAVGLVYVNSFQGDFVLDDRPHIVEQPAIRTLWPLHATLAQTTRPVVRLSLAINYAVSRLEPWSYHAFNLAVHLLATLVLFGVTLRTLIMAGRPGAAVGVSAAIALLWGVHPLQTESVTYVIQRAEAMMGLFYLLTLYGFIRGATSPRAGAWFTGSVAACALGMGCKPVMATAPLAVLLYDRTFVSGSVSAALRKHTALYGGLALTWLLLAALLTVGEESRPSAGFGLADVTLWEYAWTQPAVILHYLRLALWPSRLCLDYAWPVVSNIRAALPAATVLAALLAAAGWALVRRPRLGFLGAWFFLNLFPTSSVIPIADPAVEHRMYLPLAAVIALAVLGGDAVLRALPRNAAPPRVRRLLAAGLVLLACAALGAATAHRNADYRSPFVMWRNVIAQCPENARAYNNLGAALYRAGNRASAIARFREALRLDPRHAEAHYNLGIALAAAGRDAAALFHLEAAVHYDASAPRWQNDLGLMLARHGRPEDAVDMFSRALALQPSCADAHNNMGVALASLGRMAEAGRHFAAAVRLQPDNAVARENLERTMPLSGERADARTP
jgi:protein O-mannosyl-transferase